MKKSRAARFVAEEAAWPKSKGGLPDDYEAEVLTRSRERMYGDAFFSAPAVHLGGLCGFWPHARIPGLFEMVEEKTVDRW